MNKIYYPHLSNINPRAVIGQGCVIHALVWIADGVTIGNRVKIQAFVYIPPGVTIEDDVFVGPGVVFTNDPKMNADIKPTLVKKGVRIGAGSTIRAGITIAEHAVIGMGSVVLENIGPGETWYGNPARNSAAGAG